LTYPGEAANFAWYEHFPAPGTGDWYKTVTPRLLLISANGRQHPYAPYAEVLAHARSLGIASHCAHDNGSIAVRTPRLGSWSVRTDHAGAPTPGSERPAQ
jgi:hypothetical protein